MSARTNYESVTIYYSTGTGNSYRAAAWIEEIARAQGARTHIASIEEARPAEELASGEKHLLVLTLPTHAFTAPWAVIRFALGLPNRPGTHLLVLPSRGAIKIDKMVVQGMEGTAGYLIGLILGAKGYRLRGVRGLDMAANWMAVHPGIAPKEALVIRERGRAELTEAAGDVLSGKTHFRGIPEAGIGIALSPASLGYLVWGRRIIAKSFFASETCDGCGICARHCPRGAILMREGGLIGKANGKSRPYWTFDCESCQRCMAICPKGAVEAGHSLFYILYLATSVPVVSYLIESLAVKIPGLRMLERQPWRLALGYASKLGTAALTYEIISRLIRIPLLNRILTLTTLTHYWKRAHEPETDLKGIR